MVEKVPLQSGRRWVLRDSADYILIQPHPDLLVLSLTAEILPRLRFSLTCHESCQADAPRAGLSVEQANNSPPASP